jgi:hypothetical protein
MRISRRTDNTMVKRKKTGQKTIYKTTDRVTRTPLKTGGELSYSGNCNTCIQIFTEVEAPYQIF